MNNSKKLFALVAETLSLSSENIDENSSAENLDGWDSIAILGLVERIEEEFNVTFTVFEIADFISVSIIKDSLESKGVVFGERD